MTGKRKICVVITARPSYSRVKTALQAIKQHPQLELQIVLAGPALLNKYGNIDHILKDDGFEITERSYTVLDGENITQMPKTVGLTLIELSNVFFRLQPDAVMVIADRFETISVSIAAAYQNIPLIHLQGGEITGSIDEKVRHANTKFADVHLVCNARAKEVVESLGEDESFVFNTGCPSIDLAAEVMENPRLTFNPYKKYGGSGDKPDYSKGYVVVMQHPVTTEYEQAKFQVEETLQAVKKLGLTTFWFAPNADAGNDAVSQTIRYYRENYDMSNVQFFNNMNPKDFLRLVYNAHCLIGNSSMGIRECSFLGVPVINVGNRQMGRLRGNNVIDVDYNQQEIISAVLFWLCNNKPARSCVYGNGDAGEQIAEVLANVQLRHSKILNFQHEKPVPDTIPVGIERSAWQERKTA